MAEEYRNVGRGAPIGLCIDPLDALNIMAERESLTAAGFDFGRRVTTDVFLFGLGDPDVRESTKIGGLPFLHRGDDWPRNSAGEALPFIGQINFADSADVLGVDLPGDVLLVFGNLPAKWRSVETAIRWKRSSDFSGDELLGADEIPVPSPSDVFYGVRWRTYNFPDAAKNPKNRTFYATTTYRASSSASIFATQISSHHFVLGGRAQAWKKKRWCALSLLFLPRGMAHLAFWGVNSLFVKGTDFGLSTTRDIDLFTVGLRRETGQASLFSETKRVSFQLS